MRPGQCQAWGALLGSLLLSSRVCHNFAILYPFSKGRCLLKCPHFGNWPFQVPNWLENEHLTSNLDMKCPLFGHESADTHTQTDRKTGPILWPRPLTREVKIGILSIGLPKIRVVKFWDTLFYPLEAVMRRSGHLTGGKTSLCRPDNNLITFWNLSTR